MSNDKPTLADVKPGGRVRLGDQIHVTISDDLLSSMAYAIPGAVETTDKAKAVAARVVEIYLSAQPSPSKQAVHCPVKHCGMTYARVPSDGRCHACGATVQPSPGGQDALVQEALDYFERAGDAGDRKYVAAIRAALAARQPEVMVNGLTETETSQTMSVVGLSARQPDTAHAAYHTGKAIGRREAELEAAARRPVRIYGCCAQTEGELHTAECPNMRHLASRQPVGEPVALVVPGAPTRCRHCESTDLEWFAHVRAVNDVPHGRLTTHDVGCVFVLGCNECSETLHTVKADSIAALLAAPPAQAVDLGDFKALYRAYVRLLESGRDRIIDLGGACDPVDVMEANDVDLQAARRVLDGQAVGNG